MRQFKLTSLQKKALRFFGKDKFGQNFYWTGGTLLAYKYFHHRASFDLDFFSEDLFFDDEYLGFINKLKKSLKVQKIYYTIKSNRKIYNLKNSVENLKLELVYFPFRQIKKTNTLKEFDTRIDSLVDIMINKTLSSYQRKEIKDVYDLYFYLKNKPQYDLVGLTRLVEKKFGVAIEPILLLTKINALLDNFNTIEPLIFSKRKKLKTEIRQFFQEKFNLSVRGKIK